MDIVELINHPERMDRDTLYELRSTLALHPYFQTVRLLMLQNLYLLHDPSFDEELRRSAVYITDRRSLFNLVEAAHYQFNPTVKSQQPKANGQEGNRTMALIDTFLDSIPVEKTEETGKRRPTPKDATVDYVAYLLESEGNDFSEDTPQMQGQDLIDNFLEKEQGRILLNDFQEDEEEKPQTAPVLEEEPAEEEYFTETLARIYIKQGRYQKALDITQRLSSSHPEKNAYFADQIRFLEKLIINSKKDSKIK